MVSLSKLPYIMQFWAMRKLKLTNHSLLPSKLSSLRHFTAITTPVPGSPVANECSSIHSLWQISIFLRFLVFLCQCIWVLDQHTLDIFDLEGTWLKKGATPKNTWWINTKDKLTNFHIIYKIQKTNIILSYYFEATLILKLWCCKLRCLRSFAFKPSIVLHRKLI